MAVKTEREAGFPNRSLLKQSYDRLHALPVATNQQCQYEVKCLAGQFFKD